MPFILFPAAVMAAIVHASFFEWAFHRYWLHRPWQPKDVFTAHTLVHHQLCKFDDTFHVEDEEQHEALHFQWYGGPLLVLINMVPWFVAAGIAAGFGVSLPYLGLLITLASTILLYYIGYEGFHYLMHRPSVPAIERNPYFKFLKKHHRIHHVHMDRNLNVLFPLADLVLGTLVLESHPSGPTPEAARRLARRHSKRSQPSKEKTHQPDLQ